MGRVLWDTLRFYCIGDQPCQQILLGTVQETMGYLQAAAVVDMGYRN